ncbi:hypothetical protein D3C81_2219380 [compost metagenome]
MAPHTAPTPIQSTSGQSCSRTMLPLRAWRRVANADDTTITQTDVATATCMAAPAAAALSPASAFMTW